MREEAKKQLATIFLYNIFKRDIHFYKHLKYYGDLWKGPLYEDNYFVGTWMLQSLPRRDLKKIMQSMANFEFHSLYTRDFMQGILDCLKFGNSKEKRLRFFVRDELRYFLESGEHGYKIEFNKLKELNRYRTKQLQFLDIPCLGETERYMAGVISASKVIYEGKEPFFKISKNCLHNLKKMNIIIHYKKDRRIVFPCLSSFYIMLFCGEIPENIFESFSKHIIGLKPFKLKQACMDSLMHWKILNGKKQFKLNDYPLLQDRMFYYNVYDFDLEKLTDKMKEIRFDFVDSRIEKRCLRWYNINNCHK